MRLILSLLLAIFALTPVMAAVADPLPSAPDVLAFGGWQPAPVAIKQQSFTVVGPEFIRRVDAVIKTATAGYVIASPFNVAKYGPATDEKISYAVPQWYLRNWSGSSSSPTFGPVNLVTVYVQTRVAYEPIVPVAGG